MTIYTSDDLHINHQITLPPINDFQRKRNERLSIRQHDFDKFNPNLQEYLNHTNTKQSKDLVVNWMKSKSPVAAITMVFNCAINHKDSKDLLNRFYDQICEYQFGRAYKKRNDLVYMFAVLENAVNDKRKGSYLKYEDCNHFHLILCDPADIFKDHSSISDDVSSARKIANSNFKKAFNAQMSDASHVPQIARCKVGKYFNNGDDGWENYITKNLENYSRDTDLKFDQIAYPSIDGFIFGERIYN
jgi:hypothetical protein